MNVLCDQPTHDPSVNLSNPSPVSESLFVFSSSFYNVQREESALVAMVSRMWRGAAAVPFLLLTAWSFQTMDLGKLAAAAQPSADAKSIAWDGNKVEIIDFHGIAILDDLWRGGTATFSTSSFGYDKIAAWQVFTFLIDLGPIYAVWILESTRRANSWSPAYL